MAQKEEFKEENLQGSALVLLSGGQDSATCLIWAIKKFKTVTTLSFDYGQRHKIELDCAKSLAEHFGLGHKILHVDTFKELSKNALTHDLQIEQKAGELPSTFVPGRNLIFLTYAAAYAYGRGIDNIVTGVCQTDYSGYPDCRDETIRALEKSINLGMEADFKIHTPLMFLTKAETVKLMQDLGKINLLKYTHTCYEGKRPACGKCPSCLLRLKGFSEAGVKDPLEYEVISL